MFLETPRFPDDISFESSGGIEYFVDVVQVESGFEQRNIEQDEPLHVFDVSRVQSQEKLSSLIEFYHAVQGRTHEFRFKDWSDYKSVVREGVISATDQLLGVGDNAITDFQLVKTYAKGSFATVRTIQKPVAGTVLVSLDDVLQTSDFTIDTTTGIISFDTAPGAGVVVKAGFEFDVPCRFDTARLETSWRAHRVGSQEVIVREVRIIV